jgi:hypothetical protein
MKKIVAANSRRRSTTRMTMITIAVVFPEEEEEEDDVEDDAGMSVWTEFGNEEESIGTGSLVCSCVGRGWTEDDIWRFINLCW